MTNYFKPEKIEFNSLCTNYKKICDHIKELKFAMLP